MTDLGLSDGGNYYVGGAQCHTAFGLTSLTTELLATCGTKNILTIRYSFMFGKK